MNTKILATLIKKELWEFSNILKWVPSVIAILVIVMPLIIFMQSNVTFSEIFQEIASFPETLTSANMEMLPKMFFVMALSLFAPFLAVALIIQLYYFTVCLFDERRDLSIMFWRFLCFDDLSKQFRKERLHHTT